MRVSTLLVIVFAIAMCAQAHAECKAEVTILARAHSSWWEEYTYYEIYDVVVSNKGSCAITSIISLFSAVEEGGYIDNSWNWDTESGLITLGGPLVGGLSFYGTGFVLANSSQPVLLSMQPYCKGCSAPSTTTMAPITTTRAPATTTTTKSPATTTTKAPATTTTNAPITTTTTFTTTTTTSTTKAPVTTTTTQAAITTASASECAAPPKIIVPLYVYPGAAWERVIDGANYTKTVAILNANSGPDGAPDEEYKTYMNKLHNAGVDMVGYVHTLYGKRNMSEVMDEINTYVNYWPLVTGIFLDEAASGADDLQYYQILYQYIMSMPGYAYDIINPGTVPDSGYLDAATQIISYEDRGSLLDNAAAPYYATCATKQKYGAIVHSVSSLNNMRRIVDSILNKKYFGYVYVTDGLAGDTTYNTLATYYTYLASYLVTRN